MTSVLYMLSRYHKLRLLYFIFSPTMTGVFRIRAVVLLNESSFIYPVNVPFS